MSPTDLSAGIRVQGITQQKNDRETYGNKVAVANFQLNIPPF